MIDLTKEKLISLNEAGKLFPRRPSKSKWWRLYKKGVGGHCLEVVRYGKSIATSVEAVQRFLAHCSATKAPPVAVPPHCAATEAAPAAVPPTRHAAMKAAAAKLSSEGI